MTAITPANGIITTVADAARHYLACDVHTIPVEVQGKRPWNFAAGRLRDEWEQLRVTEADIDQLYPAEANIGIVLGAPSKGIVDTDLDCAESRRAAPHLLPKTEMIGGRESASDSHYFHIADHPPEKASESFIDPITRKKLLELRSTGGQTVVSPSVYGPEPKKGHRKAERFVWSKHGSPARVSAEVLLIAVRGIAAAALLGRYWPKSSRHDAALALAGALRRAGWLEDAVVNFVTAICAAANDGELSNRVGCVRDTFAKPDGEQTTGWTRLKEILGERGETIVKTVTRWLRINTVRDSGVKQGYEESSVTQERYVPIPDYVPFPTDCLPPPWNTFVREGATALSCDEGLVALPLIGVIASAIGNTRRVHLGAEWFEPSVFWTCVVAESGSLKSPAAELSTDLVQARQKTLVKDFKEQLKQYKQELREYKKPGEEGEIKGDPPEEPTLKRVMAGDTTIEKLVGLLDDNARGLLVYRDELSGWINSFTRYKGSAGGSDESNWLSMHRAGPVIYDRKTGNKTTVFVAHAAVSVTGGIQPGTLKRLMTTNFFESGLVARILFVMPPRTPKKWTDKRISEETKDAAVKSLDDLFALAPEKDADDDPRPVVVKLSPAAQKRMREFVDQWGIKQFEAEGARAAALSKLEAVPGRFALIHHIVKNAGTLDDTQPIELESVEAGITLAEWASQETDRVYAMLAETEANKTIRQLIERVKRIAEKNDGRITVKLLQRAYQRKYRTADLAKADLERLVGLGLGEWEAAPPRATGGWTPTYFILHTRPRVTDDSSYPCPGGEGGEPQGGDGDSRPDRPNDDGPQPQTPSGESSEPERTCDDSGRQRDPQEYEESSVTHDPQHGISPMALTADRRGESHHRTEASVTQLPNLTTTADGVRAIAAVLKELNGPAGVDTETTGLNTRTDRVRLIQVAAGERVWVIDVFALPKPVANLAPLFEVLALKEVVGHNLQFDLRMLAPLGFVPGDLFDTMLASRVLHAGERAVNNAWLQHGLADAVERELGQTLDKEEQRSDWSGPLTQQQIEYAIADAAVLVPLANALRAKLQDADLMGTANREFRALPGIAWAQPVTVDTAAWIAIAKNAEAEQARLAEEMDQISPNPAGLPGMESRNWDSPQQVKEAFSQVGVTLANTDDDTLAGVDHPLAELLRDYRAATKRTGTYGRKWVKEHVDTRGRVLPSWNQLGAESGRMSCSDPNLQQIPRGPEYRRCFVARPGHVLVKADYSQVELRIAAKIANEKVMIKAYRDGRDLHTLTAARILNKPESDVVTNDRQLAKAVNFGLLYGMGWKGLKQYAKANYNVELTDKQAQSYRNAFFRTYPALASWHKKTEAQVKKLFDADPKGTHEVHTLGGRRRVLRVSKTDGKGKAYPNKTDALNTPVQGSGADGLKTAISLLWHRRNECPNVVPVIFCHDEIVLEAPEAEASEAMTWLRDCMIAAVARRDQAAKKIGHNTSATIAQFSHRQTPPRRRRVLRHGIEMSPAAGACWPPFVTKPSSRKDSARTTCRIRNPLTCCSFTIQPANRSPTRSTSSKHSQFAPNACDG